MSYQQYFQSNVWLGKNPISSGYGKTFVCHVISGLNTAKWIKQLKLDPYIYASLQKERVEIGGDVIYAEANSGTVKCQSRSVGIVLH